MGKVESLIKSRGPYSKLKRKESQEEVGSGEESIPFDANAV